MSAFRFTPFFTYKPRIETIEHENSLFPDLLAHSALILLLRIMSALSVLSYMYFEFYIYLGHLRGLWRWQNRIGHDSPGMSVDTCVLIMPINSSLSYILGIHRRSYLQHKQKPYKQMQIGKEVYVYLYLYCISYGSFVCAACIYAYLLVCIPVSFKARNLVHIHT